jgi:hypothetical protein
MEKLVSGERIGAWQRIADPVEQGEDELVRERFVVELECRRSRERNSR